MKNLIFLATLLIFMLNISGNAISAEAKDDEHDPVLDMDGNELKTGNSSYYIVLTFRLGGGVTIYPWANKTCTYGVAALSPSGDGLPVTFSNGGTDLGEVVRESTDLMIAFKPGSLLCPAVWKVEEYDKAAKQYFVTAGEIARNETSSKKWFQIRKASSFGEYRFVSCPKVCEFCTQTCTDVGINKYGGVQRFALRGFLPSTFKVKKFSPGTPCHALAA